MYMVLRVAQEVAMCHLRERKVENITPMIHAWLTNGMMRDNTVRGLEVDHMRYTYAWDIRGNDNHTSEFVKRGDWIFSCIS